MVYLLHIAGRTEIPEKYKSLSNSSDDCYRGHLHSSLLESFHPHNWLNTQNKKPITQPNSEQDQFNPDHKNLFPFDSLQFYIITIMTLQRFLVVLSLQADVRTVLQMRLQVLPHLFRFIIH